MPKAQVTMDGVLDDIRKDFGKESIARLGDKPLSPVSVIPTGSVALDEALGVGGFPRGRIVEAYGPESSGKTSVALTAVANAQKMGLVAAFIDAEHALDPSWADILGVDTDALLVSQPDNGEQALGITERLCLSGKVGIVVVDSVSALVPKAEIEGEMGDSHIGLQARLMSQALRKLTPAAAAGETCVVFINQLREKVGVLFGSPETTSGGKALKFYASVRLDVRRASLIKEGLATVGYRARVRAVKNKVATPFGVAEFDFMFGVGISREGELIDMGVERGVVRKAGAWYTFGELQLGQGKENARKFLVENDEVRDKVQAAVRGAEKSAVKLIGKGAATTGEQLEMTGDAPWGGDDSS